MNAQTLSPTDEQLAIVAQIQGTQANVLVNALAGTGKTTTLDLIQMASNERPVLCLAFNKRIADEMQKRFGDATTTVRTFNSLGHRIWAKAVGKVTLDVNKTKYLLKVETAGLKGDDKKAARDAYWDIISAVALAKSLGYIPRGRFDQARRLISADAFWEALETRPSPLVKELIDAVLIQSIRTAYQGNIDFNDQIYMPALFGGSFPRFPLVLVDEGQDLSPTNHAMLDKLAKQRICVVGDRWQSIYGFRGAVREGVDRLRDKFNLQEQGLTVSFRCPKTIVEAARWRVPHFKWIKPGGHYEILHRLSHNEIPEGAAVICRNNAPLFRLAFGLLSSRRSVQVAGSDIGPKIVRLLQKIGAVGDTSEDLISKIEGWTQERLQVSNAPQMVKDQAECMKIFATFGKTLSHAVHYAEHLFAQQGTIKLLTGHKAKGGEWKTVYHLDPWLIGTDDQELNLRYVITTRAQQSLYEINSRNILQ